MHRRAVLAGLCASLVALSAAAQEGHFHHVHLNSVDPEASIAFYKKIFGAVDVQYAGRTEALFVERSFILFDRVEKAPPSELSSPIWHIGWGGIDGPSEYAWLKGQGVRFQGELNPLGSNYYMYMYGPDDELIEIFTGEKNHRFNHVHLIASDVNETTAWLAENLGLEPRVAGRVEPRDRGGYRLWSNGIRVDNVSIIVFGLPEPENPPPWWPEAAKPGALDPSDGRAIDHIAFSYTDIDPVFERMKARGTIIADPIRHRESLGTRSFFATAPDGLLVEVVEAKPIPDAIWE